MPLPHLHFIHPALSKAPHLPAWLADVERTLRADTNWDTCNFRCVECNDQAAFDVPTVNERLKQYPGPVIVIEKVQARLVSRLRSMIERRVSVYTINPCCSTDIWELCESARVAYDNGEPLIAIRELVAYLILRKLAAHDMWGGTSLNKNFLWAHDLPRGGFPMDYCNPREILEVADHLLNINLLIRKRSDGKWKYALGDRRLVQPILDTKEFADRPQLQRFFDRGNAMVPAKLLDFNE